MLSGVLSHRLVVLALVATMASIAIVVSYARVASAHNQAPLVVREIVRLQGYLGDLPSGLAARGETTLQVLAERYRVRVTDWQVFSTTENAAVESPPPELRLQGSREDLAKLAAMSNRRITVLAERRPGSTEIFLLALDVCPPLQDGGG